MPVEDDKQALRERAGELRRRAAAETPDAAERLADNFVAGLADFDIAGAVVSAYWPMGEEMDVRPLLERLHAAGRALALPVVGQRGEPLVFRRWRPGEELAEGVFGTCHPGDDHPPATPGVVIAPLLAFDDRGGRLGWGAGYYDRTLAGLRAAGSVVAVGVGYAAQRFDTVPQTERDEPLDWIVTEAGAIRARR